MSITQVLHAPYSGRFGGAVRQVFGRIFRRTSAVLERIATAPRETPPEVYRFPLF